jgi:pilus assembly protein Flp/PilA
VAAIVAPRCQEEKSMLRSIRKVLKSKSGATAIEYGLIAALVSVVIIATLLIVGTQLSTTFSTIGSNLSSANN